MTEKAVGEGEDPPWVYEDWLEKKIQELELQTQAAHDARDYAKVDELLYKLDSFELVLADVKNKRLGLERDPIVIRAMQETLSDLHEVLVKGGSVEDAIKILGDSVAVSRAQIDQDLAQKYEEDPEWEEKEAQAEDERRLADGLRISPIIKADLEQVRKIQRMEQQIEDARERLKATDDRAKQAACRSEIEFLTPELECLRAAARQGRDS